MGDWGGNSVMIEMNAHCSLLQLTAPVASTCLLAQQGAHTIILRPKVGWCELGMSCIPPSITHCSALHFEAFYRWCASKVSISHTQFLIVLH